MVYALGNFARKNNQTARSLKSFKQRIHISCNKKAFRWQNNYSTCVNLRKLTKEFYVRFVFGIIVTTCIKFPSLLAKDHTHTHTKQKCLNSAFATHTHIVRTRFTHRLSPLALRGPRSFLVLPLRATTQISN